MSLFVFTLSWNIVSTSIYVFSASLPHPKGPTPKELIKGLYNPFLHIKSSGSEEKLKIMFDIEAKNHSQY